MATRVSNETAGTNPVMQMALSQILVNEQENMRRVDPKGIPGLAKSIEKYGLLQPLVVKPLVESQNGFTHRLDAGYRRMAAIRSLDWDEVMVTVLGEDADDMGVNMTENGQREDPDYISLSKAIRKRIEGGAKIAEIAADLNKTVAYVHYLIPLSDPEKMRPVIQKAVADGKFTFRLARLLPSLTPEEQDAHLAAAEESGSTKGQTQAAEATHKKRKAKNKEKRGRKAKGDSSEGGGISAKKAVLLMEEVEGELKLAAKAEDVDETTKAAIKDAVWTLQVFGKFLSGAIGAQALGKKLTNKMAQE